MTTDRHLETLHTAALRNADAAQSYADQALDDMRAAAERYANASRSAIDARRLADGIKDRMNAAATDAALDYKVYERSGDIRPVKFAERVEVSRDSLTHTPTDFRNVELDLLAHVTEGDPDPHPEQNGDVEMCWEQIEATGVPGIDEFTCTRPEGHPGQHIAGDGHEVVKVWNRG